MEYYHATNNTILQLFTDLNTACILKSGSAKQCNFDKTIKNKAAGIKHDRQNHVHVSTQAVLLTTYMANMAMTNIMKSPAYAAIISRSGLNSVGRQMDEAFFRLVKIISSPGPLAYPIWGATRHFCSKIMWNHFISWAWKLWFDDDGHVCGSLNSWIY